MDATIPAIIQINFRFQILIASDDHCRLHTPHEKSLVLILPCHEFLHGKIKGETATLGIR